MPSAVSPQEGCLNTDAIVEHLQGAHSNTESEAFESHIDTCADCRRLVADVARRSLVSETADLSDPHPQADTIHAPHAISAHFAPGDLAAQRFRIIREVGRGAMGSVFEAIDTKLDVRIALKVLNGPALKGSSSGSETPLTTKERDRLDRHIKREVLAARRISHVNICRIHDIVELRGHAVLSMEFLPGENLSKLLTKKVPRYRAFDILVQLCEGLEAAHQAGIVHRDLKPANIIVGPGGRVTITDFGLAIDTQNPVSTHFNSTNAGTPAYWAPEQSGGQPASTRSDIYALGVIAFELLYGTRMPPTDRPELVRNTLRGPVGDTVAFCLSDDPNLRPSSARQLRNAIMHADENGKGPDAHTSNLLRQEPPLIGRETLLEDIITLLVKSKGPEDTTGAPLLTLVGTAGVGKTCLARTVGKRLTHHAYDGVWFCDLTDASSAADITASVATQLSIPLLASEEPQTAALSSQQQALRFTQILARRGKLLLILDNCEQVVDHAEQTISRWLQDAPEIQILATSRTPLGLQHEVLQEVPPLEQDALGPESSPAEELFIARFKRNSAGTAPERINTTLIQEIVQRLDGIPLAIELAAARAPVLGLEQLLERLPEGLVLLDSVAARRKPGRKKSNTLRGAIDWSWALLHTHEQEAMAKLSLFRGGFDVHAAEGVLEGHDRAGGVHTIDIIESLRYNSLLRSATMSALPGEPLFSFYESVRRYAEERFATLDDNIQQATREKFVHSSIHLANTWATKVDTEQGAEAIRHLAMAQDNLLYVFNLCEEQTTVDGAKGALEVFLALAPMLDTHGQMRVIITLAERAMAHTAVNEAPSTLQARVFLARSRAYRLLGDSSAAKKSAEMAIDIARSTHDNALLVDALTQAGRSEDQSGHSSQALECYTRAMKTMRTLDEETGGTQHTVAMARVYGCMGVSYLAHADLESAKTHFEKSLQMFQSLGCHRHELAFLWLYGALLLHRGEIDAATEVVLRGMRGSKEFGDRRYTGTSLVVLAWTYHYRGDLPTARRHYREGLHILTEVSDERVGGMGRGYFGLLRIEEGDAGGLNDVRTAIAQLDNVGDTLWAATLRGHLSGITLLQAESASAEKSAKHLLQQVGAELNSIGASWQQPFLDIYQGQNEGSDAVDRAAIDRRLSARLCKALLRV